MEFKQLQSFAAVVKYQSFTKAAEQLYISQPTISAHIRQLEEEVNFRLIVRTTKSIEITPRGKELYDFASHVLSLRDDLTKRWSAETENTIRLGTSTIPSTYILPELLPAFRRTNAEIQFNIHQSDSMGIIEELLHGSYEVGLVGMKKNMKEIEFTAFYEDNMVLITPVNEHFIQLKEKGIPAREIVRTEPILLREQTSGSLKFIESYFRHVNLNEADLNIIARLNDQESIKQLVSSGLGVSIISGKAAENYEKSNNIMVFELPEQKERRKLYIAYRKDFILKAQTQMFIDFVKTYYQ